MSKKKNFGAHPEQYDKKLPPKLNKDFSSITFTTLL
jgi:hypothetical protein